MRVDDYWLLTQNDGDFFLIEQPSLEVAKLVKTYHQILVSLVRASDLFQRFPNQDFFSIEIAKYYQKIADLLNPKFNVSLLEPNSRHQFFIACEPRENNWISGLELLLGMDYVPAAKSNSIDEPQITSGDLEIDVIGELLLNIESGRVEWLVKSRSPQYLIKLLKQMGDRRRGQEALDDITRKKDLEKLNNPSVEKQLQDAGFNF